MVFFWSPVSLSYPAVGATLLERVLLINNSVTAVGSDPMTLLRPRGRFHWPAGEEESKVKRTKKTAP